MENIITLGQLLKGNSSGKFVNINGEYCTVLRYYIGNKQKFQVIFGENLFSISTRPAINSTSEKKIVKFLTTENFKLV
jgi:hypothetical protein